MGHILNLSTKFVLCGENKTAIRGATEDVRVALKALAERRKNGPLAKHHKIVEYICGSPQRQQVFRKLQNQPNIREKITTVSLLKGKCHRNADWILERDVDTRWNSTYSMINRAIHLKASVNKYLEDDRLNQFWATFAQGQS
jgi:hypothetical protein